MKKIKSAVLDNPEVFKTLNGWLTVIWIIMVPVSVAFGWVESVAYVSALSIYALVTGHLSTWAAARTEIAQSKADSRLHEDHKRLQKMDPDHDRERVDEDPE